MKTRWLLLLLPLCLIISFSIIGLPRLANAQDEENKVLEIDDPLTNSRTVGNQNGGTFTAQGWKTYDHFNYIQYNIPTCPAGEIEFDIQGIYASNEVFNNLSYDKQWQVIPGEENIHHSLFSKWDRDDKNLWYGQTQWHNPYKCIMPSMAMYPATSTSGDE